jgi:chemotaxis protein CheD
MNHFVHPQVGENDARTTTFGNVALPVLVKMMHNEFGSRKADLRAQIFGGGSPMRLNELSIGKENIAVARKFLADIGIRVVSEDVGGNMGRKILFDTATGETVILKVQQLRREDWVRALSERR